MQLSTTVTTGLSFDVSVSLDAIADIFMPARLSTNPREITLFVGRYNRHEVFVAYEGRPIRLDLFSRFELFIKGAGIVIDSDESPGSLVGRSDGVMLLNIAEYITEPKPYKATLIGFSSAYPSGVVLWEPTLSESSLTINARSA